MRALENRLTALEQAAEPVNNVKQIVWLGSDEEPPPGYIPQPGVVEYIKVIRTPEEAVAIFDILADAGCVEDVMAHQQIVTG